MKEFKYTVAFDDGTVNEGFVDLKDINKELYTIFGKKRLIPVLIDENTRKVVFEKSIDFEELMENKLFIYSEVCFIGDKFKVTVIKDECDNLKLIDGEDTSEKWHIDDRDWVLAANVTFEILGVSTGL